MWASTLVTRAEEGGRSNGGNDGGYLSSRAGSLDAAGARPAECNGLRAYGASDSDR
jgi:hypothetical protein